MNIKYNLLILALIGILQISCNDDIDTKGSFIQITDNNLNIIINDDGVSTLSFTTDQTWTISVAGTSNNQWLTVSELKGNAGNNSVQITAKPNDQPNDRMGYITLESGGSEVKFSVFQELGNGLKDIPIPDKTFRAYCIENFDLNKDGLLSAAEAKRVKEIGIITFTEKVKSLEGIEYFSNLRYLYTSYTEFTELDLRRNKQLETISCELGQLEKIDLSQNIILKRLSIRGNNVSEINIDNNTNLTNIELAENPIKELTIKNNNKLTGINLISFEELRSLTISNCQIIRHINIDNSEWEMGKLEKLTLSNIPKLENLYCGGQLITQIDLSEFPNLINLSLRNLNNLTLIDVTNNAKLYYLDYAYNPNLKEIWIQKDQNLYISKNPDTNTNPEIIYK